VAARRGNFLGLHEYDGKLTDYSRASIEAELARLKRHDECWLHWTPQP